VKQSNPKKQTSKRNSPSVAKRGGLGRIVVWSVFLLILVAAGMGGFWYGKRQPKPPQVALAALDPSLTQHITAARSNVLASRKSAPAWGKYGEALHAGEFHPEAQFCYSNAAVLDPKSFRWPYLLGLLQVQDNSATAILNLERATELAAGETDSPRYQLARVLVERGRFDEARQHLQRILAARPDHAAARVEMARIHVARREFKEATQELQPALTNNYTMRAALFLAAQMAQRNGQRDAAAQLARRASSLPRSFDWPDPVLREVQNQHVDRARLADQANGLLQQKRLQDAEGVLSKLVNAFPDDAEGLLLVGRLRYLQNRCAEAEGALRRHLIVQPGSLNGLIQLSLSLLCQQQWSNAIAVLEQAVAIKPDFAQAHSNLGLARSRLGDSAGAIRAYRDVLRCSPGDVNAHFALAEELANSGQVEQAREHVRHAAAISPNDARLPAARQQLEMKENR
jgi:tetratricopeptide (TPR) repeat protein